MSDMTFEEYLDYLTTLGKPRLIEAAHQAKTFYEENLNGTMWDSDRLAEAVMDDVRAIVRGYYHHERGAAVRCIAKRKRAAQRAAETKRRTAERYGPGRTRNGEVRDSQRQKVYRAEMFLQNWGTQERWTTVPEMQEYVDKLLASAWWKRRWPTVRTIKVEDGAGRRSACSTGGSIKMPRWSRMEAVILHEIAHEVIGRTIGHRNHAAHGREFCNVLLELVGHKMGPTARMHLKDCFKAQGVKFTKPRKPMSEEQRAAAAERLAKYRKGQVHG